MDPNARLAMMRTLVRQALAKPQQSDVTLPMLWALATDFSELDQWLTNGGRLPNSWAGTHRDTATPLKVL